MKILTPSPGVFFVCLFTATLFTPPQVLAQQQDETTITGA